MRSRKDSGFSLLEIIIVLAIMGGILASYTQYVRKKAEKTAQHNIANALVAEMKGVINFVNETDVAILNKDPIVNPLYDTSADAGYAKRITNELNTVDTGNTDNYFLWGNGNSKSKQQRYYFLSDNCKVTLKSQYKFEKEYLPCFMSGQTTNSLATIDRVGLAGGTTADRENDVNRVDVIVKFKKAEKNSDFYFADYYPSFSDALTAAGISASHAIVLHRNSDTSNWNVVVNKKDNKTPVEFSAVAKNMDALEQYTRGDFAVRYTFDFNDNQNGSGGGGGGASVCWTSKDTNVKLCYDKMDGQGEHGEDAIVALNMTDKTNLNGNETTGTLKANVVLENTSRRVYMFQRQGYSASLIFDANNNPQRYTYTDDEGNSFEGDFMMGDENGFYGPSDLDANYSTYVPATYDAFELVTPVINEYHSFRGPGHDVTGTNDYVPDYDDSASSSDKDWGPIRIPVQSCPQVKQSIALRDGDGNFLMDGDGNPQKTVVVRKLYPRLSASISSVQAYNSSLDGGHLDDISKNRSEINSSRIISHLAGVTTQIEFAENNETFRNGSKGVNSGGNILFKDTKYLWIVSTSMGLYDGNTGEGATLVNSPNISFTISKWCSKVPQQGTPADVLDTFEYK